MSQYEIEMEFTGGSTLHIHSVTLFAMFDLAAWEAAKFPPALPFSFDRNDGVCTCGMVCIPAFWSLCHDSRNEVV
jgi:hypothetical protein